MKLCNLTPEVALFELREQVGSMLSESISDYLALTGALLKNDKPVNLDKLAEIISGLKVLSDSANRGGMTKDDIGINPNSYAELFKLLNSITKQEKDIPKSTTYVFSALKSIAPSLYKRTRAEVGVLETGTKQQRQQVIQKLQVFTSKVNQMFYKLKHGSEKPKNNQPKIDLPDNF